MREPNTTSIVFSKSSEAHTWSSYEHVIYGAVVWCSACAQIVTLKGCRVVDS